ncbi:hypothetical protein D3C87_1873810 [compost metagenome]
MRHQEIEHAGHEGGVANRLAQLVGLGARKGQKSAEHVWFAGKPAENSDGGFLGAQGYAAVLHGPFRISRYSYLFLNQMTLA